MFFVIRVLQGFQEVRVSPNPADVLRWAGSHTLQTDRQVYGWIGRQDFFQEKGMSPAIAEVIYVMEPLILLHDDLPQAVGNLVQGAHIPVFIVLGIAEVLPVDLKHMQMRVRPAHDDLDGVVQPVQRGYWTKPRTAS